MARGEWMAAGRAERLGRAERREERTAGQSVRDWKSERGQGGGFVISAGRPLDMHLLLFFISHSIATSL